MEINKELTVAEKKKEVLSKLSKTLEYFEKLREDLLSILEINTHLNHLQHKKEEQKKETTKNLNILKAGIEKLKKDNFHRTNDEIHILHKKISDTIPQMISKIVIETKMKSLIITSDNIQALIAKLGKNIKTGVAVEVLAFSDNEKFKPIKNPLDLDNIRKDILGQLNEVQSRLTEISNIQKVVDFLDLKDDSKILEILLDYVILGKNYDELKKELEKHSIEIEEIVYQKEIYENPEAEENLLEKQLTENLKEFMPPKKIKDKLKFYYKVFHEWLYTNFDINFKKAKQRVIEKERNK